MKKLDNNVQAVDYALLSKQRIEKLFDAFHTSIDGISEEQYIQSKKKYGNNQISYGKSTPLFLKIIKAYITPFTLILFALGVTSFITDVIIVNPADRDFVGSTIIFTMIIISGSMTLIQSNRSSRAAQKLRTLVEVTTIVKRNNRYIDVSTEDIVSGDIVSFSAGNIIPADVRLIKTKDLFISQSALTGESYPVEKKTIIKPVSDRNISETSYKNLAFMGSNVISGTGEGIVIATGNRTLFAKIASSLSSKKEKTNFEIGLRQTSFVFIKFMALMAPIVFIVNVLTKGHWIEALLFGLSVAVGLTPEMLPMIVTTNLVKGATTMAKKGTIVKNINSIQNFGAMDVLCTDKTGTLTRDKIILEHHLDLEGNENEHVLHCAYLNSQYQTGLKNLLDAAILEAAKDELDSAKINFKKIDEIPFDFNRRRMSVVVEDSSGKTLMITKGAIEEMINISSFMENRKGEVVALTESRKLDIVKIVNDLNDDGLRVIGVAQKINPTPVGEFSVKDESEMILIGFLAFLDPPKETAAEALGTLKKHGVDVKVLTGDNVRITKTVCKKVGLDSKEVLSGENISKLTDEQLRILVENHNVFVKLTPHQKQKIIRLLKENGHTVGFMGDGINDAPALKHADVGISVDTATDIAKDSADIILLKKDLMILEKGILLGRESFGNIMKYIKITASSNFGNMFSVLVASSFLPFLPMLPLQILILNMIYDTSCISVPWDRMDKEYMIKPKFWDAPSIKRFMIWFGPTSSVFDITTYLLMYFVICPAAMGGTFETLTPNQKIGFIALFHTGWFIESLWTQMLVLHALRTDKIPFIQSRGSLIFITVTTIGILLGSIIPFTSFGRNLGLRSVPISFWLWLCLTILAYLTLVSVIKRSYESRYGKLL